VLLHGLEHRRLRFGRRAVDLVRQHDVREHRARREYHLALTGRRVVLDDVRAGDVRRHQVGRELDARELEVEDARDRMNEQRLRQAGHANDERVATREERDEDLLDDVVLSDDELPQLG
jgi:hypothetical protein